MQYKNYQNARDAAWRILRDCAVAELPVKVSQICRQLGIRVVYCDDCGDGWCSIVDGVPVIFVSRSSSRERQRFTAAHELGHIVLGHAGECVRLHRDPAREENPIEQAANVFAARILAPACVLWALNAWTPERISSLCGISRQAAYFRAERMALLQGRGKFLSSPLEREVYRNFMPYIDRQRSSASGR